MAGRTSFGESAYERGAQASVQAGRDDEAAIERRRQYAIEAQREARLQAIAEMHQRHEQAKEDRDFAESVAAQKHAEDMERQATEALKRISAIKMSGKDADPDALAKLQAVQTDLPGAFIGKGSIQGIYMYYWDHGVVQQAARDTKAAAAAEKASTLADRKSQIPAGFAPTKATVDGVTYEPSSKDKSGMTPARLEKLRGDFDRSANAYHSRMDEIAASDTPKPELIERRNFYRNQMLSFGKRLGEANPEAKDEVDQTIKDAVLSEHAGIEAKMNSGDKTAEAANTRKALIPQINPLKKILGFNQLDPETGKEIVASKESTPETIDPQMAKDDAELNAPTETKSAVPAVANPNISPEEKDTDTSGAGGEFGDEKPAEVAPVVPAAAQPAPAAPAQEQHPLEGKRVLQKSTGKYGSFVNGQFVPE